MKFARCCLLASILLCGTLAVATSQEGVRLAEARSNGALELTGLRRILHNGVHDEAPADSTSTTTDSSATTDNVDLHSSHLISAKGGAIAVFFAVPFIGVWIPFFFPINQELLKYGLLFASGLFFALALEHLLPDASSGFTNLSTSPYPFAFLLVVAGYMFTWFADLIVHAIWERKAERDRLVLEQKVGSTEETEKLSCCKKGIPAYADESGLGNKCSGVNCNCNGDTCRCAASGLEYSEHQEVIRAGGAVEASAGHHHGLNNLGVKELGFADLILLVLALCFHAVFEGLATGLAASVYDVWTLTWQIVVHKLFEGMALGAALKAQNKDRSWLTVGFYAVAFSIMAPVGIAIGIALDTSVESRSASWVEAVGNGLAAGVFIFVAVSHLMVKGFRRGASDRWWTPFLKWAACFLGATVTSLCQIPHDD